MTEKTLRAIDMHFQKQGKNPRAIHSAIANEVFMAKEYGYTIEQYSRLPMAQKRLMEYFQLLQSYNRSTDHEFYANEARAKADLQRKQTSNAPAMKLPRRR